MYSCPLCGSLKTQTLTWLNHREFYHCQTCDLRFLNPTQIRSDEFQKEHYLKHQNDDHNHGYRKFLSQLLNPMLECLDKDAKGLDFGCGYNPLLSKMLKENGYEVKIYDKFFFAQNEVLEDRYDFITASEVIEHLETPRKELSKIISILKPQGFLGIMTGVYQPDIVFENWSYIQDLTHVSLYSEKTFSWIASSYNLKEVFLSKNVIIFQKEQ